MDKQIFYSVENSGSTGTWSAVANASGFCCHTHYREKLRVLLVSKTLSPGRSGVGMHAVAAAIDRGCGNIDQFLGEGIERTRLNHNFFDA